MDKTLFANMIVDSCESTNDIARELARCGFPHGTWIAARTQTVGRGRYGRRWVSGPGNLFLSVIVDCGAEPAREGLPLLAARAVAGAISVFVPGAALKIKPPNDIYLDDAKLAGILCETAPSMGTCAVVGVGVNCMTAPDGLDVKTACLGVMPEMVLGSVKFGIICMRY